MQPNVMRERNELAQLYSLSQKKEKGMVVGENHNFFWTESELNLFLDLWKEGKHISEIAKELQRPEYELGYLIIYLDTPVDDMQSQEFKKKFKRRKTGVFGA